MIEKCNGFRSVLNFELNDEICRRKEDKTLEKYLREVGFGKWIFYTDLEIAEEIFKDLSSFVDEGKFLAMKYSNDKLANLEYSNGKSIFCVYAEDKTQVQTIELITNILGRKKKYDSIKRFCWKYDAENMDIDKWGNNRHTIILD